MRTLKHLLWFILPLCLLAASPHHTEMVNGALAAQTGGPDPLPSWKDTKVKQRIIAFVKRVTERGNADYVPVEDRIATFDNDGTLWCEMPLVELIFTLDRLKALAV